MQITKLIIVGLLGLVHFSLSAQCDGVEDFNTWMDASELLEEDFGLVGDQAITLPENWTSLFRPFTLGLSTLGELPEDSFELANNFFGLKQEAIDNSTTDFAMCLTPDEFLNVSDAISFFFCEDEPNSITLNLSHVGTDTDTLQIVYIQRQGDVFDDLVQGIGDPSTSGATAYGAGILVGGIDSYRDVELNIERFPSAPDDRMVPDTAVIWLIATSGAEDPEFINTSYCINNMQLNYISTSTDDASRPNLTLSPNPADRHLQVEYGRGERSDLVVYDVAGRVVLQDKIQSSTEIDLGEWASGIYTLQIRGEREVRTQKFVKR